MSVRARICAIVRQRNGQIEAIKRCLSIPQKYTRTVWCVYLGLAAGCAAENVSLISIRNCLFVIIFWVSTRFDQQITTITYFTAQMYQFQRKLRTLGRNHYVMLCFWYALCI